VIRPFHHEPNQAFHHGFGSATVLRFTPFNLDGSTDNSLGRNSKQGYPMLRFALIGIVSSFAGTAFGAGVFPKPLSYDKPVGTEFVFVQLGNAAEEVKHGTSTQRKRFTELRAKYAKPGLYRVADASLVWELPAGDFTPIDLAFLTTDGRTLIRIEGDFWQTESFPGGYRPSEDKQKAQLEGPAVTFFRDGQVMKQYRLNELILQTETLKHTPEHLIWYASASLNAESGRFLMYTQESRCITFDFNGGTILEVRGVGLANSVLQTILLITGAMTLLILAGWGWFVYRHRVPDGTPAVDAL